MNKQSYLDSNQLQSVCDHYLSLYDRDIEQIRDLASEITIAVNNLTAVCEGESFIAFEQYIERTLTPWYQSILSADECDIRDIKILKSKATKTFDGNLIISSYEQANINRDKYNEKAANERILAASFNTTVTKMLPNGTIVTEHISNPHEALAKTYQENADAYQKEMDMWYGEMMEFDAIEEQTANLFTDGLTIRKNAFGVDVHDIYMEQLEISKKFLQGFGPAALGVFDAIANLFKFVLPKEKDNDTDVTLTNPGWIVDNAGKYGMTEMEARYLEEYYPDLVNSLYGVSGTDHQGSIELATNNLKTKLSDDYFYTMEERGYAYEAICYLHENNPGLMSSLYAVSHYDSASVDDVRMSIFTYLSSNGICVYDPVYDFDAYNVPSGASVTGLETQFHTNCYAYAFGLTYDPRTGGPLPFRGLQPGYISGKEIDYYTEWEEIYSSDESNDGSLLVKYIKGDAAALGLKCEEYHEGMTGGVRVALVIDPADTPDEDPDYHWYYYDEASGTWFNKQGISPATNCYLGEPESYYNPQTGFSENQGIVVVSDEDNNMYACVASYGEPIGDDYYAHATSCGEENDADCGYYVIDVGEFYITRLDGGDFN